MTKLAEKTEQKRLAFIEFMDARKNINSENGTLKTYDQISKEVCGNKFEQIKIRKWMASLYPKVAERMSVKGVSQLKREQKQEQAQQAMRLAQEDQKQNEDRIAASRPVTKAEMDKALADFRSKKDWPLIRTI